MFWARRTRHGFTLVELLVVIAIIGILVALLLPAIQSARESARRADCSSRMRQLGLAVQMYEEHFRVFPPAASGKTSDPSIPRLSVLCYILNFLELGNISANLDYSAHYNDAVNKPFTELDVPIFLCPSAPPRPGEYAGDYTVAYKIDSSLYNDFTDIGYVGTAPADALFGVLQLNATTTSSQCEDGLTNTFLMVEDAGRPLTFLQTGGGPNYYPGAKWAGYQYPIPISQLDCGINQIINCKNRKEIYSFHPGGANFLYGGTGVTFAAENMNPLVFIGRFTRAGEELTFRD